MIKKNYFSLLTIMIVAIVSVGFVSCSSDDNDGDGQGGVTSIVGTWKLTFGTNEYALITLNKDGTGLYREFEKGEWEDYKNFTYVYEGTQLLITRYSESRQKDITEIIEVISLTATQLILKDWPDSGLNTFVKQ